MEIKEVNNFIVLQKLLFFIVVQNRTEALKRADYSSFSTKFDYNYTINKSINYS